MTKKEILKELDRLGVKYPKKALKRQLQAILRLNLPPHGPPPPPKKALKTLGKVVKAVAKVAEVLIDPVWVPDWSLMLPFGPISTGIGACVGFGTRPRGAPPKGGKWVRVERPAWAKHARPRGKK